MATKAKKNLRRLRRHSQRTEGARKRSPEALDYRSFAVRARTLDEDARSVEALITSETPVLEFDWDRYEMVPRVLLTSGAQLPTSKQIPFLDSHNRSSVQNQLGSARGLKRGSDGVEGNLFFSSVADAEEAFTKTREGHLTDVSAGFVILEQRHVPAGETQKIKGTVYEGPINVATKWALREVSLVPIGADEAAKLRGLDLTQLERQLPSTSGAEVFVMNEELRQLLIARGMDKDLSDEEAQEWLVENREKVLAPQAGNGQRTETEPATDPHAGHGARREATPENGRGDGNGEREDDTKFLKLFEQFQQKQKADRKAFRAEVDELCQLGGVPDIAGRCYELDEISEVRKAILTEQKRLDETLPVGGSFRVNFSDSQPRERALAAMGTALSLRCMRAVVDENNKKPSEENIERIFPKEERSKDAADFQYASVFEMARECLQLEGFNLRGKTREEIAIAALGWPGKVGLRSPAIHVTGSFPQLTLDAKNKSMQLGYVEAPATWRGPMRQGASVQDFKTINRLRLGSVPNLPVWNDNDNPERASIKDANEPYAIECRSLEIDFSYKLIVNDDMDALSRIPGQLGNAAGRTVNALAWAVITANPAMGDGQALFLATPAGNRKRSNLTTGSAAPTVATLQTLTNKMMQMRGENTPEENESDDILGLVPRYLVGPSALSTTIKQLVLSVYDPAASAIQVYNPATELIPVIEPRLDADSTTAFYLFCSTAQCDTAEVTFLQGQESPVTRSFMDERKLSQSTIVLQSVGAKALNHRGMQKHAGA